MGGEGARPPSLCARLPLDPPALPLPAAPSSPFLWAAHGVERVCAFFGVCVSAKNLCFLERENHSCLAPPGETFRRRTCGAPVPPVPPHPALTHECEPPRVTGTGRAGRTPCPASPQARRRRRWATCARARGGAPFHPPLLSPAAHTHSLPAHPPPPARPPPPVPTHIVAPLNIATANEIFQPFTEESGWLKPRPFQTLLILPVTTCYLLSTKSTTAWIIASAAAGCVKL